MTKANAKTEKEKLKKIYEMMLRFRVDILAAEKDPHEVMDLALGMVIDVKLEIGPEIGNDI